MATKRTGHVTLPQLPIMELRGKASNRERRTPVLSILDDLIEWSRGRPKWQQDAMRRVATAGQLSDEDVAQLLELCKRPHGLAAPDGPAARPLQRDHVPDLDPKRGAVALLTLDQVANVNALAPGQQLRFGSDALTIIYGDNGTGKSSYARILKKLCRARGASPRLLQNVLDDTASGVPRATLRYRADGEDAVFRWQEGSTPPAALSEISVFDSVSASAYVGEKTDLAYRPVVLSILHLTARACERVRSRLAAERRALERTPQDPVAQLVNANTAAGRRVQSISLLTDLEELASFAQLSEAEERLLPELRSAVALASAGRSERARANNTNAIEATTELGVAIRALGEQVSRQKLEEIRLAALAAQSSESGYRDLLTSLQDMPLPGVGSPEWLELWRAAEAFSNAAPYPSEDHPYTGEGSRCVFCQQPLEPEAVARLERWREMLASQLATDARKNRRKLTNLLDGLPTPGAREELFGAPLRTLDDDSPARLAVVQLLDEVDSLIVRVRETPTAHVATPSNEDALTKLRLHLKALRLTATSLQSAVAEHTATNKQIMELEARKRLSEAMPIVRQEVSRLRTIAAYHKCERDTSTNAITMKVTSLTQKYVSESLNRTFLQELQTLGFRHVALNLANTGGSQGSVFHRVEIPGSDEPLSHVVSEGEARCLALASFLTELTTSERASGIIFDDPVSSLDHRWRDAIARRLVVEAKSRQVIVLTHDIVFTVALLQYAKAQDVEVHNQYLRRGQMGTGVLVPDLPWPALPVGKRIGVLKNMQVQAAKLEKDDDVHRYEAEAQRIYGLLRETWERAIEEVLLHGVVERFRASVQTLPVRYLEDISGDDVRAINDGMGKCSTWLAGHDHSAAQNLPFPGAEELLCDIHALEAWVKGVRRRRR